MIFRSRLIKLITATVLTVSLAATPVFAVNENQTAETTSGNQTDETSELAALSEQTAEQTSEQTTDDDQLAELTEDPEFYKYNTIDKDGNIEAKPVQDDTSTPDPQAVIDSAEGNETDTSYGGQVKAAALTSGNTSGNGTCLYINCIDVSYWQHEIDWNSVKASGIDCAFIRCGYSTLNDGSHCSDSTFSRNINDAVNAGIKVGVYYYSTATDAAEAASEAQYVSFLLTNYKDKIELPVVFDYETGGRLTSNVMQSTGNAACRSFCDTISAEGYTPMIYANWTALTKYIGGTSLDDQYKIWLAQWSSVPTFGGEFYTWQYTSSGRVNGINGNVDMNYIFEPGAWEVQESGSYKMKLTGIDEYYNKAGWLKWAGQYYYLDGNFARISGMVKLGAYYYGFDGNGISMRNGIGWFGYCGYSFDTSGRSIISKIKIRKKAKYYTGPSTKYQKKGTYKKGKKYYVLQRSGKWSQLNTGYWVKTSYLTKQEVYPIITPDVPDQFRAKLTKKTRSYSGPSNGYIKKRNFKKNKKVTVVGTYGGWAKVSSGQWLPLNKLKKY